MVSVKFILGQKIGSSQIFDDKGMVIPVTLVKAGPCMVTQIKSFEKDGYSAIQIGFGKARKLTKPKKGGLKKIKITQNSTNLEKLKIKDFGRWLREFRIEKADQIKELKLGDQITVNMFKIGEKVNVTGISKGKGFTGVIKRHGFSRGPESHGSDHHREPGSIGSMFPQRVVKGRKLPGRAGNKRTTVKNLKIIKIDRINNIIYISGAIPGAKNGLILIQSVKSPLLSDKITTLQSSPHEIPPSGSNKVAISQGKGKK